MKLETEEQYNTALARAERIFFAKPGTPEGDELDVLATAIEAYEEEHYPMTTPEDEALIERLARAACWADGRDPDELVEMNVSRDDFGFRTERVPAWRLYEQVARCHLAMQRELALTELARVGQEFDRHDKDTDQ